MSSSKLKNDFVISIKDYKGLPKQMTNNGKAKIENNFDGLTIIIPSKKNWFALLFGTVWMGGWLIGFTNASGMVLFSENVNTGVNTFMLFWLMSWTIGGAAISFMLLWGYFGQEKFITDRNEVLFEKTIFGYGIKKKLELNVIKNFKFKQGNDSWYGNNRWAFWGLGPGKIKFDYGLKTYTFGLGVDDAEAHYIIKLLKEQFKEM